VVIGGRTFELPAIVQRAAEALAAAREAAANSAAREAAAQQPRGRRVGAGGRR
jgi:hypothetical protein